MDITELGITTRRAASFRKHGINTVEDLLNYLPRKYNDYRFTTSPDYSGESVSCLIASIISVEYKVGKKSMVIVKCRLKDSYVNVDVKFFNQDWRYNQLCPMVGHDVFIVGKLNYDHQYRYLSMICPETFDTDVENGQRIHPVYRKIPGVSQEALNDLIVRGLNTGAAKGETVPADILDREKQISMATARRYLHAPETPDEITAGQRRLVFDDLLYFAVRNELATREYSCGSPYNIKSLALKNKIQDGLPYKLTADQQRALNDMITQAKTGKRINALVQGDVGCGKTIVALLLASCFLGTAGNQVCILAPTQVLAKQHYSEAAALFEPYGIRCVYLGSGLKAAEKRKILADIALGKAQLVIGTHSVITDKVLYSKLVLTIADEEHKFGVSQRSALVEKGKDGVHSVSMSATPIPRSLASVLYGDTVQLHTIISMPAGRLPVFTKVVHNRPSVMGFLEKQARKGRQAYVVCPMIDKSEDDNTCIASVEQITQIYHRYFDSKGIKVEELTGRNTAEETAAIIERFRTGATSILIATTVVEVGVSVPNATVMVVENAERFGLASLHQLRGRVGRNSIQSFCFLLSDAEEGSDGAKRLEAMCKTTSGFEIAKEDLALRGPGDLLGIQQSGDDNKYMKLVMAYPTEYQKCKEIASDLLDRGEDCCELVRKAVADSSGGEEAA